MHLYVDDQTHQGGGYAHFIDVDRLGGKRLGIVKDFSDFGNDTFWTKTF